MGKFAVTTLTTADSFQHYIPIFIYTLKKYVPEAEPEVFVRGLLDEMTKEALKLIPYKFPPPVENALIKRPNYEYSTNCLRFFVPINGYDYVYYTDVDFVFFEHEPNMVDYYIQRLEGWNECYWGRKGFKRRIGTDEPTKRIAAGGFLAKNPEWYDKTMVKRIEALQRIEKGELGIIREDDETMLWRICAASDLKLPTKKINTRKKKYKELHLGDFKFFHRWTNERKMKKKINRGNFYKWQHLEKDPVWKKICDVVEQDRNIKQILANVREYMGNRKGIKFEND